MRALVRKKDPKVLLSLYTWGALVVLCVGLALTAIFVSKAFIDKEKERSEILVSQLKSFFTFQYRDMAEEMFTRSYESVAIRIERIAKQVGTDEFDLKLIDPNFTCVYAKSFSSVGTTSCSIGSDLLSKVKALKRSAQDAPTPFLEFDEATDRYLYIAAMFVGELRKGYIVATIPDPYEFNRGGVFLFKSPVFWFTLLIVLLLWVCWHLASRRFLLRPYVTAVADWQRKGALGKLAIQLAHDLTAPIAGIRSIVLNSKNLEKDERDKLRSYVTYTESLADDLLTKYKDPDYSTTKNFTFINVVVNSTVKKMRDTIKNGPTMSLNVQVSKAMRLHGVRLSATDLERVLYNILFNSKQALESKRSGSIDMRVSEPPVEVGRGFVRIEIEDDGKGMDEATLKRVLTVGGSYGKDRGVGMGLSHAREVIGAAGGRLDIQSRVKVGTKVILDIPLAYNPSWLATQLVIPQGKKVLVLEDEESIVEVLKLKLAEFDVTFISDPEDFDIAKYPRDSYFYILDYEIIGNPLTGLDLINQHGLGADAILFTGYFHDSRIQKSIESTGAKLLPKVFIEDILIQPNRSPLESESEIVKNRSIAMVDDEPVFREIWKDSANSMGVHAFTCANFEELKRLGLPKDTIIFLDKNQSNSNSGFDQAKILSEEGYREIFIITGERSLYGMKPDNYPEIKGIISKEFPGHLLAFEGNL